MGTFLVTSDSHKIYYEDVVCAFCHHHHSKVPSSYHFRFDGHVCVGEKEEQEVKSRTFDSNSNRINIFDIFENSPPSSTFSDSEPSLEKIIEEDAPSPKKKAELYQWLNTSYYGSMIRKVSSQTPYQPDYVRIEDNMTVPIFEKEEIDEHGAGMETNSLLNEHKVQIDPQLSSTAPGSRSSETYELCKSCTSRYTRHRTTRHARTIWLVLTTMALSISFFPYGLFSVVLLLFIPPQIRRPICKKCRTSFWGF